MVNSQYTSDFSKNINSKYYWFRKVLFQKIKEKVREFTSTEFDFKFVGLSEKDNVLFAGEEYFVTKIKVNKNSEVFLRISSPLINLFLEGCIGKSKEKFVIENLTELEAKILTGLNDYVYKGIDIFLSKGNNQNTTNTNLLHVTILAKNTQGYTGKYIISIPINILPEIKHLKSQENFGLGSFPNYKVPVKILTGKSEISLFDIRHIEHGDIVVLEQSNIKKMVIDVYGNKKAFILNPETSIITGIDNDGGESVENNEGINSGTMWDSIPVEITAEFESVSISLGELKQIAEGSVVDVGAIYENKIFLKVENKPIASGELIIINDKYAVRVDEVYTDEKKTTPNQAEQKPATQPKPASTPASPTPANQTTNNDEDFNYDNFDIEDDDI